MPFKLVVTKEFHDRPHGRVLKPGDHIFDQGHVERLSTERERNTVRVAMTAAEEAQHMAKPSVASK